MSSITLSPGAHKALLDPYRHAADPEVRLPAHILLLLGAGYPRVTISAALFYSPSTVSRWKARP